MNVLIAGENLIALRVAEALMAEHQVSSLRSHTLAPSRFDRLDVLTVHGEAASPEALRAARVAETDVFVGATDSDELNVVACLAARRLGARRTICVAQSHGFLEMQGEQHDLADSLGIDQVIRPGEQLAREVVRIVTVPEALDARVFADGRVFLLRYAVEEGAPITSAPLKRQKLPRGALLVMVRRGEKMIVPEGSTKIQAGDKVMAMGKPAAIEELVNSFVAHVIKQERRATIIGAGSVGLAIARGLERAKWSIKLLEVDQARCDKVASEVRGMVLHGDGADLELLEQERIGESPVVVCVTNNDEKNLLVSLLAKELGAQRIVTRADRLANERMFEKVGIDVVLSARGAAVRSIVDNIDASHADIRAELEHGSACVMELVLPEQFNSIRLADLRPPETAVVGSIQRGRHLMVPQGGDHLHAGDQILVFCSTEHEDETRDFFMRVNEKD
jgi:trk system potassium uptake protein TrkA